jgi:protein-S-isoprenylcysteine O-methyltransferase Ste14
MLASPAAAWILAAAGLIVLFAELAASWLGGGLRRRRTGAISYDRGTRWIIEVAARVGIVGALVLALFVPAVRAGANTWWTFGLGIASVCTGVALRAWAIVTLGPHFRRRVTIEPGQTLVRRGPYRVLRHPSYTGLLLVFAGFGLAFGSWLSAAVAALGMLAGLLPRIRVEERALAETFGAEYERYAASTSRLVPSLW